MFLVGSALLFVLQMALLIKTKRVAVRLIPAYLVCAVLACAGFAHIGVFGAHVEGAGFGNELAGLSLLLIAGIEAVGPALAWAVYGIALLVGKDKEAVL